jgi:putative oxidoreductase
MLLAVRLYWGFQFAQAGWGHLHSLPKLVSYFTTLNIPFPALNAPFIACLEFVGGILMMLGLFSRPIAFLLAGDMFVAFWAGEHDAFISFFSDLTNGTSKFVDATAYTFLFASLMILIFGSGLYSVDTLIVRYLKGRSTGCPGCGVLQNDKVDLQSSSLARSIAAGR